MLLSFNFVRYKILNYELKIYNKTYWLGELRIDPNLC